LFEFPKMVPMEMLLKNLKLSNYEDVIHLIMEGDTEKFPLKYLKDLERFITNEKFEKEIVSSLIIQSKSRFSI